MAGKTQVSEGSVLKVSKRGKLSGEMANGAAVDGTWAWREGFCCRTFRVNGTDRGTDCQVVELDGNRVRCITGRGNGRLVEFTLK